MKKHRSVICGRDGAALVIALLLIVMVTFLVVAFLSSSTMSRQVSQAATSLSQTQDFADGVVQLVIEDLQAEIASSSDQTDPPYFPKSSSAGAVIERSGVSATDRDFAVLRKVSRSGVPLFPGLVDRASGVSTATDGLNISGVLPSRWDAPLLIRTGAFDAGADIPPPDWIYVNRSGGHPTAWSTNLRDAEDGDNYVVGRFAFALYDTGGLLDINVAGYPPGESPAAPLKLTSVSYADLRELPAPQPGEPLANAPKMSAAQIDAITSWRNSGTFATTVEEYHLRQGGLRVQSGDDNFLGRQDLLAFLKAEAMPGLGRLFTARSRFRNSPGGWPETPTDSSLDYRAAAENPNSPNRFTPGVLHPSDGTITAYRENGTSYTYDVVANETPLMDRRFALHRLRWLGANGPANGGTAQSIRTHFGLEWVPPSGNAPGHWNYVEGGSPQNPEINSFGDVATESPAREPNFFEILKAGILQGSLGSSSSRRGWSAHVRADEDINAHILQIGANIIDQYDADSLPTLIRRAVPVNDDETAPYDFPSSMEFVTGVENLPHLYALIPRIRRISGGTAPIAGNPYGHVFHGWLIPFLWNPHANAASAPASTVRLRVTDGGAHFRIPILGGGNGANQPWAAAASTPALRASATSFIQYNSATLAATPGDPSYATDSAGADPYNQPMNGLYLGKFNENRSATSPTYFNYLYGDIVGDRGLSLVMEVQAPSGEWIPYQRIENFPGRPGQLTTSSYRDSFQSGFGKLNMGGSVLGRIDPRGSRYGWLGRLANPTFNNLTSDAEDRSHLTFLNGSSWNTTASPSPEAYVIASNTGQPLELGLAGPQKPFDMIAENAPGSSFRIPDRDGVIRRGDADSSHDVYPLAPGRVTQRPVVLNRAFTSVADLGAAFRDQPWKNVNLFRSDSADAGLLDLFSLYDEPPVVAGKITLNTPLQEVLAALLSGAPEAGDYQGGSLEELSNDQVREIAAEIVAQTQTTPMGRRADLAALSESLGDALPYVKHRREVLVRALGDVGDNRTWNLLIDLVAQTGRFTQASGSLEQFLVDGERRYWIHLAIDRFTAEVIDFSVEPVTD